MDNTMSTAAFIHRSGSSSASSTGTGSSSGGGPGTGNNGGSRMAVIGVTRNVRLRRRGASGFGFSLRGGREYAAGFYVSDVQPGGEAHRAGLRVGDQIIRVNGYPVEDAVHQEVALLAKNQQVLVLKIRSVGMIPVKDNPNDPVTWHMVQGQQQQIQYNEPAAPTIPYNEVRIRVMVGEKGRLGCGVCKGIVPGLTVQGTREGGPARAAGLKAGDVIVWCNGQRLTDLPFERAIEVMRGAAILDLVVNRPIPANNGLYDCPETLWMRGSSGYDSESSSIGPVSPPSHGNPSSPQHQLGGTQRYAETRNGRACCPLALSTSSCSSSEWSQPCDQGQDWTRKPNNTTVIRVNQNVNQNTNQYRSNIGVNYSTHPACHGNYGITDPGNEPLYDPVTPREYESHDFDANPLDERNRRLMYEKENIVLYDPPGDDRITYSAKDNGFSPNLNAPRAPDFDRKTVTTVEVHQSSGPPAPPCPPPMSYKWQTVDTKPMMGMNKQMGSTMSMGSTGSTETESSLESCGKDSASTSSSLSTSSCEPASSTVSFASTMTTSNVPPPIKSPEPTPIRPPPPPGRTCPPLSTTDLGTAIAQELQRRAQQRAAKAEVNGDRVAFEPKKQSPNPEALKAQESKVTHDKLMEEFKRAHQKMFNQNQQKIQSPEQDQKKEQEKRVNGSNGGCPPPPPLPLPGSPMKSVEEAVEMQSIESFKLKETPSPVIPKPPPTYFSASANSSPTTTPTNGSPRHAPVVKQSQLNGNKDSVNNKCQVPMEKKNFVKIQNSNGPIAANTGGKVAVRIGSYEGETKQPSRLEFLPQGRSTTDGGKPVEEVNNGPVVSRLQNELAATLQRSNLRKKTDEEIAATPQSLPKPSSPDAERPVTLLQSNVEKLAAALANRVTIKVSPENGSR
ncbi:uncharacterized protein LOC135170204 isoform X1 [Diachasmimorpha longicaudata]|uniref:uncharacterized protein LOC135170204 isoform X1 n=2 Tax=Diachasmimorpha longicaudata TaxID=58733 RepID=UPI0030B8DA82